MQIRVLGPLQARRGSITLDLGSAKPRALLAALALNVNRPVALDTLIDFLWGDAPPAAVTASMHSYVSILRKAVEPDRAARAAPRVLLTAPTGYELRVPADAVDAHRFAQVSRSVHARLGESSPLAVPAGATPGELDGLLGELTDALSWWRAEPYPELDHHPSVEAERVRLQDLRLTAVADRSRIQLALGHDSAAAADLGPAAHDHPLREDLWALLALALVRAGRQGDALAALRTVRSALDAELGIDPGPTVRELEIAVLRQDVPPVRPAPTSRPATIRSGGPAQRRTPVRATAVPVDALAADPPPGTTTTTSGHPPGPTLVGRDAELSALLDLLDDADAGVPRSAMLIGEPGIGKTRLTEEFAARAADRGFGVHTGRCTSDEGAPPLWPWVSVLGSLAEAPAGAGPPDPIALLEPDRPGSGGGTDRFAQFEAVAQDVARTVLNRPHLLVFDDLHWADPSTLSLLRHVTERIDRGRLVIVATRRSHPAPTGALADYAETLARRNALRLDLSGLAAADVGTLAAAGRADLPPELAARLRDRTGGNPFFVLELLRAGPGVDAVPAAVGDVITARVGRLPADTQRLLRACATLGRGVDPDLLARVERLDVDDALDALEPAVDAGLLVVTPAGELRFAHALVRDAVEAADSPLRRHRRHAVAARALHERAGSGRNLAEIARHWLRAGPAHAAQAWPAAMEAADYASGLAAHEEAADLLAAALTAQAADPAATPSDRYDLLLTRATACQRAADNAGQRSATTEAIEIATALGDVERAAAAAIAAAEGGLWSNVPEGPEHQVTVAALRTAARDLPAEDSPLRCRVFLALSRELYWTAPGAAGHPAERVAFAERGFAMARRLRQPLLQAQACRTLSLAIIGPSTLDRRTELMEEAITCSRAAGDPDGEGVGLFWRVVHAGEAGRIADRRVAVAEAMAHVEQHRLRMLQVMLGAHQAAWLAMEGRFDAAEAMVSDNLRRAALASFPFRDEAVLATRALIALWRGDPRTTADLFHELNRMGQTDAAIPMLVGLVRSGQLDVAADELDRATAPLDAEDFGAPFDFAILAEVALVLGRPDLAGRLYPLMLPWSGRVAAAGTGPPLGPIDAFLACAAAAVGETALAGRHADTALRICDDWGVPLVAAWLSGLRQRFGF
jgi:DNA-binding SARP family transcriptional activator